MKFCSETFTKWTWTRPDGLVGMCTSLWSRCHGLDHWPSHTALSCRNKYQCRMLHISNLWRSREVVSYWIEYVHLCWLNVRKRSACWLVDLYLCSQLFYVGGHFGMCVCRYHEKYLFICQSCGFGIKQLIISSLLFYFAIMFVQWWLMVVL